MTSSCTILGLVGIKVKHSSIISLLVSTDLRSMFCGQQFPSGGGLRMYVQLLSISFRELIGEGGVPDSMMGLFYSLNCYLFFKPNSSSFFLLSPDFLIMNS